MQETYAVQQQGETLKARDERALRMAAAWYKQRVLTVPTLLLLSDAGSVAKAREEGLSAVSPEAFIKEHLKDESLLDLIPWCAPHVHTPVSTLELYMIGKLGAQRCTVADVKTLLMGKKYKRGVQGRG